LRKTCFRTGSLKAAETPIDCKCYKFKRSVRATQKELPVEYYVIILDRISTDERLY